MPPERQDNDDYASADNFTAKLERQHDDILANRRPGDSDESIARRITDSEQELLIATRLGDGFPRQKREALMAAYRKLQAKRNDAALMLVEQAISAEEYAARLQAALDELTHDYSRVLTPAEYHRLSGEIAGVPVALPMDASLIDAP